MPARPAALCRVKPAKLRRPRGGADHCHYCREVRPMTLDPESERLAEDDRREKNWKRWGTYLSARQWGTVREDYSAGGECWSYLPHDHARSRAYRWGGDGLLGWTDREC